MSGSRFSFRTRLVMATVGLSAALAASIVLLLVGGPSTPRFSAAARTLAGAPTHRPIGAGPPSPGRLGTVRFYSPALHREADYLIYLPADYTPAHRLPAIYLLHGMPGWPLEFTVNGQIESRLERLIRRGRVQPMILVFPDGRIDGRTHSDSEWANSPSGDFESYLVNVVHDVDHRFAALRSRSERAIAGLSAGAYGAANVGLHQVKLFGLIQVWSGYFTETHNGVFAHASPATIAYSSPIDYIRRMGALLHRYPLRTFLYVGRNDGYASQLPPMAAALSAEGAHNRWAIYPGSHSWKLWTPHVPQMLAMASHDFRNPLPEPGAQTRGRQGTTGGRSSR